MLKIPSGIPGLDEVTGGGLPAGRTTLVCGGPGCGKSMLAAQFLVRGILDYDEPGVFISFEETPAELSRNFESLGWNLEALMADGRLTMDTIAPFPSTTIGDWDLDALKIRLQLAIDSVGATRVVIDTIEMLINTLTDRAVRDELEHHRLGADARLRSELRGLFHWLQDRGVTTIVTGERGPVTSEHGQGQLSRAGLEEYASDCVILLDQRVRDQIATRRMRVVKYRGSRHDTDEFPFLIDDTGIVVVPSTTTSFELAALTDTVSSGVPQLDGLLGAGGYYRGTSVLISGGPGTGKSSLLAAMARAATARGERSLLLSFEESPQQIIRNMRSISIDLEPAMSSGLLTVESQRPAWWGLETHLAKITALVDRLAPQYVLIDPVNALRGPSEEVAAMLSRLVTMLKSRGITTILAAITDVRAGQRIDVPLSSLIDTWINVSNFEHAGERNRGITVFKSRGMSHSNQVRELLLTDDGISIAEVYAGPGGVLMGTARRQQELEEELAGQERIEQNLLRELQSRQRLAALDAQIAALTAERAAEEAEARLTGAALAERSELRASAVTAVRRSRGAGKGSDDAGNTRE